MKELLWRAVFTLTYIYTRLMVALLILCCLLIPVCFVILVYILFTRH